MINKTLIIPGYIVGIGSLIIITYRTILAYTSNTKSVTVNINRFGEQNLDLFFLAVIWIISILGLIFLLINQKDKRIKNIKNEDDDKKPFNIDDQLNLFNTQYLYNMEETELKLNKADISKETYIKTNLSNDGSNLSVTYNSINSNK